MKRISDTPELLVWFKRHEDQLRNAYRVRIESSLCRSIRIQKSIAYHTVHAAAIKDGYDLTECQINKLVLMIMMKE